MAIDNDLLAVEPPLFTSRVKLLVPDTVGAPEMVPSLLRPKPEGRSPWPSNRDHV